MLEERDDQGHPANTFMADSLVTSIPFSNAQEQIISNLVSSADELISVNIPITWSSTVLVDGTVLGTYTPSVPMKYVAFIGYSIPYTTNSCIPTVNPVVFTPGVTQFEFSIYLPASSGSGFAYNSVMTFTCTSSNIQVVAGKYPGSPNYSNVPKFSGIFAIFS